MAKRPVFCAIPTKPFFEEIMIEFEYFSGFSLSQKRKSIQSLHESFELSGPLPILEVSTKSPESLGTKLSAYNLHAYAYGRMHSIESIFQSSKVFEKGGPYLDLLDRYKKGIRKKDHRLQNSGEIISFNFEGKVFPTNPKTLFYDWIYINALHNTPELSTQVVLYQSFTDIEFNPNKSINCQAKSVAIYVGLCKSGLIEEAVSNIDSFKEIVYEKEEVQLNEDPKSIQMKLF